MALVFGRDILEKIVSLKIVDMTEDGRGIGKREDGYAVFVKGAIFGQEVRARLAYDKGSYGIGELVEVVARSPWEREHFCKYGNICGGCPYGILTPEGELELKKEQLVSKLYRIGKVDADKVKKALDEVKNPSVCIHYRNKGTVYFGEKKFLDTEDTRLAGFRLGSKNRLVAGFVGEKSHSLFDCSECMVQCEVLMATVKALREYCQAVGKSLPEKADGKDRIIQGRTGENTEGNTRAKGSVLNYLTTRISSVTGEVMVILGVTGKDLPYEGYLTDSLARAIESCTAGNFPKPYFSSFYIAMPKLDKKKRSRGKTSLKPLSEYYYHRAGNKTIIDTICGSDFEVSPESFFQGNPFMAEEFYNKAMEYGEVWQSRGLLDLYCGVGTLGIIAAKQGAKKVIGIERVKSAILDSNRNSVINGIVNSRYICGKAESIIKEMQSQSAKYDEFFNLEDVDVAIVDPPRAGCKAELLDAIVEANIKRLVYVSCNPSTMARDVKHLAEKGYELKKVSLYNQYFGSGHSECVALLERG